MPPSPPWFYNFFLDVFSRPQLTAELLPGQDLDPPELPGARSGQDERVVLVFHRAVYLPKRGIWGDRGSPLQGSGPLTNFF